MSQDHNSSQVGSSQIDSSQHHVDQQHNHNRRLNKQDYKTLTLAALGGALEFYDFIILSSLPRLLVIFFFPADMPEWLRQVQTFGILLRVTWLAHWGSSWHILVIWLGVKDVYS